MDAIWRVTNTAPTAHAIGRIERGKEPVRAALVVSDPLTRSLGRPNREQVVTTRPEELSTLQALDLTNGRILADLLDRGAKNLRKSGAKPDDLVVELYRAALSRKPTDQELATTRTLLGATPTDAAVSDLLWAVFMLPEFQFVR